MRALTLACGIGALSGSRAMLGPALVARYVLSPPASRWLTTMAAGEFVADKSSRIGNRTDAFPLVARVMMGAVAAGVQARQQRRFQAAVMGAAGACAAAYACYYLRREATRRLGVPNILAGLIEDVIVVSAGTAMLRRFSG